MSERRVSRVGRPAMRGTGSMPPRAGAPRRSKKGWVKAALAAAVVIGFWQYFKIDRLELRNLDALDPKAVELAVKKGIEQQLLGNNLVTISSGRLEKSVTDQIPEIKDIALTRNWPGHLIVAVVEREPSLAWQSGGQLYLLDRDGTVIRELSGQAKVSVVVDTTNLPVEIGTRVVPERFVKFTLDTVRELKSVGGGIRQISVVDTTSELNVGLEDGYLVRFDTTREAGEQLRSLNLVLAELKKQGKKPAEYVDLRVEGKAYYK